MATASSFRRSALGFLSGRSGPRRPGGGLLLAALAGGGLLAATPAAEAYVRSRADSCKAVYWAQTCIFIQADTSYTKDMPLPEIESQIDAAINAWQSQTMSASFIVLKHLPATGPLETTYKDNLQVIKFRADTWCRPTSEGGMPTCYDPSATAITTVSYVNKAGDPNDGQIIDADIELNAVNNHFFNKDTDPTPTDRNPADLWNTLAHEMGHMQGLDHTCRSASESATSCTVDNTGAARPLCSAVAAQMMSNPTYAAIFRTTMYAVASPGETTKRMPKADDVLGITDSYPIASDPKSCVKPGSMSGGCNTLGPVSVQARTAPLSARGGLLASLFALVIAAPLLLRRRTRPS
jgi:hypothetical protein